MPAYERVSGLSRNGQQPAAEMTARAGATGGQYAIVAAHKGLNVGLLNRPRRVQKNKLLRSVYDAMIRRCHNCTAKQYRNYGARGITVCERWRASFHTFFADMGPRPTDEHQIDRIDNDGSYTPENCRWVTRKEQNRNKRTNVWLELDGERCTPVEWAERTGLHIETIRARRNRGWSDEMTLRTGATRMDPAQERPVVPVVAPGERPSMWSVTARQEKTLEVIASFIAQRGVSPTLKEVALRTGMGSTSMSHHLSSLERKGYIAREPGVARGIRILRAA